MHANCCAASKTRENACISIDKNSVVFRRELFESKLFASVLIISLEESWSFVMPPKRAFRNSKSVEQERNVSDLLGPPRDVVDVVDVPDLDLNYEVRDEELCNMPMPSEVFHIEMSKSVFHNCTV